MDYILYGAGTGASLAVIGWVLREWGPRLRDGRPEDGQIQSASELIDRMSWARFCASCGMALVFGGTLILLVTAVVAVWNPGDDLAARILIGTYIGVSLLLLVWSGLYTRQFGTAGIYRPAPPKPVAPVAKAVEAEITETTSDESAEETVVAVDTTSDDGADSERDIESVAASRGGMGRFAAFFNRSKPDPEPTGESLEIVDEIGETDSDGEGDTVEEMVAIEETGSVTGEEVETVSVPEEVVDAAQVEPEDEPAQSPDLVGESTASDLVASGEDVSANESPAERTKPDDEEKPPSPEADALTELRRRRLARLSGDDTSGS